MKIGNGKPANAKIAIVGAGLSGLSTAFSLQHLLAERFSVSRGSTVSKRSLGFDVEIKVFESSHRIGGVIQTEKLDGFLIDHGADMFATNPPAAMAICDQLGVSDQLLSPLVSRRGARISTGGKLVPIPEGFVLMRATRTWPMLTTSLLTWPAKLRFLAERFCRSAEHDEQFDESVADFVSRRMGRAVLDQIVAPLAAGIYTADVNRLSMRSTMGPIHQMEKKHGSLHAASKARARSGADAVEQTSAGARYGQFRAFPNGMAQLINAIADALPSTCIEQSCPVHSIRRHDGRWEISLDGSTRQFDQVVIAAPVKSTAQLLHPVAHTAASVFDSIRSASTAIIVLGVKRTQISKDIETFGFVVPPRAGKQILAGSFASHKFSRRAPADSVLLRCFVGGMLHPEAMQRTDEELIAVVREELQEMIGLTGKPQVQKVIRWPNSMPQYEVGHHRKVEVIEAEIAKLPNLWVNNNALHGVGIAPLIQQAQRTAESIVDSLDQSGSPSPDE